MGALLAERPVTLTYRSVGDTFCMRLPRERFVELVQRSAPFRDFSTRRLGAMLDLSRQQLQQTYAAEASAERTMGTPLGDLLRGPAADLRARNAAARGVSSHGGCACRLGAGSQTDSTGESVTGILTRTDLIGRVILPEVPLSAPVRDVMTPNVLTLDTDATAADATLLMAEHSIRHIPVMHRDDGIARVAGVVSERDLFALQRLTVRQLAVAIRRAHSVAAVAAAAADVRRLSHHLVAQGVAAAQLTRLISHLNDQLTVRLLTLGTRALRSSMRASFCWLSFGQRRAGASRPSRPTRTTASCYVAGRRPRSGCWNWPDWTNEALAACGFPLCKGNIMARNPALVPRLRRLGCTVRRLDRPRRSRCAARMPASSSTSGRCSATSASPMDCARKSCHGPSATRASSSRWQTTHCATARRPGAASSTRCSARADRRGST